MTGKEHLFPAQKAAMAGGRWEDGRVLPAFSSLKIAQRRSITRSRCSIHRKAEVGWAGGCV